MRIETERRVAWVLLGGAVAVAFASARSFAGGGLAAFALLPGAGLGALACVPLGLVPSALRGRPLKLVDTLGPWLLALDAAYARGSGAGIETGAFACALALGMLLLGRESGPARSSWPSRSGLGSALPFGLLCLVRPEGPLAVAAALAVRLLWLRADRTARKPKDPPLAPVPSALARELGWLLLCAVPFTAGLLWGLPPAPVAASDAHALGSPLAVLDWRGTLSVWFHSRPALHGALWLVPLALFGRETRRAAVLGLAMACAMVLSLRWTGGGAGAGSRLVAQALPAVSLLLALVPVAISELLGLLFFAQGMAAAVRASEGLAGPPAAGAAQAPDEPGLSAAMLLFGLRGVRLQALALRVSAAVLLLFAALALASAWARP